MPLTMIVALIIIGGFVLVVGLKALAPDEQPEGSQQTAPPSPPRPVRDQERMTMLERAVGNTERAADFYDKINEIFHLAGGLVPRDDLFAAANALLAEGMSRKRTCQTMLATLDLTIEQQKAHPDEHPFLMATQAMVDLAHTGFDAHDIGKKKHSHFLKPLPEPQSDPPSVISCEPGVP